MEKDTTKLIPLFAELSNGERYAYRELGSGPKVVLLIHGYKASSAVWIPFMRHNLSPEIRFIAVDLRSCGNSSYNKAISHLKDLAEDLSHLLDALGTPKAHAVIGHSMGGTVAALFAAYFPTRLEFLVLACTVSPGGSKGDVIDFPDLIPEVMPSVRAIKERKEENSGFPPLKEHLGPEVYKLVLEEAFNGRALDILLECFIDRLDEYETFSKIKAKTLVVHAAHDEAYNMKASEYNVKAIGENAKLVVIEANHYLPVTAMKEFSKIVQEFIE